MQPRAKSWPHYAVSDPRVRVKVGDRVYPGRATRLMIDDPALTEALQASAREKYDFPSGDDAPQPTDLWLFKIESAPVDVAAP